MKKGFTLIELLAVILILGIIALIAIPTVNNIISEAKESATKRSAEEYIRAVEQAITLQEMKGNTLLGTMSVDDLEDIVELKGTKPTSGTITIENNTVISCNLQIEEYSITCNGENITITKGEANDVDITFEDGAKYTCNTKGMKQAKTVYFNPNTGSKCTEQEYNANLASHGMTTDPTGLKEGCMKWYIFNDSNGKVDMILDHNTTATVAWNSSRINATGPNEVLNTLKNDTKNWTGVPLRTDTYSYHNSTANYDINYSTYRARLIEAQEIARITGSIGWDDETATYDYDFDTGYHELDSCDYEFLSWLEDEYTGDDRDSVEEEFYSKFNNAYTWLLDYTYESEYVRNKKASNTNKGYWTSSAASSDSGRAWCVIIVGGLHHHGRYVDNDRTFGVRPVITISKSLIS